MSHHRHPSIDLPNGTSFHFVDASPHEVLRMAREAATGHDVRLGGGPSIVRQLLRADLIDFMHLVIVPITLGRRVSLLGGCGRHRRSLHGRDRHLPGALTHRLWNKIGHD